MHFIAANIDKNLHQLQVYKRYPDQSGTENSPRRIVDFR